MGNVEPPDDSDMATQGRTAAVQQLGKAGANFNLPSPRNRLSPLHMAAQQYGESHIVVAELVKFGAEINAKVGRPRSIQSYP